MNFSRYAHLLLHFFHILENNHIYGLTCLTIHISHWVYNINVFLSGQEMSTNIALVMTMILDAATSS